MPKLKLNCQDLSNRVQFVMKTRQNNDLIDHPSAFYVENDTELSLLIESGVNCDENHIGQLYD